MRWRWLSGIKNTGRLIIVLAKHAIRMVTAVLPQPVANTQLKQLLNMALFVAPFSVFGAFSAANLGQLEVTILSPNSLHDYAH